jgi:hypothetical protein
MMRTTTGAATAIAAAAVLLAGVAPAQAAAPSIERVPIEASFHDDFLTGECGVDVTTTISGFRIVREFVDGAGNLIELATINVTGTSSSEFGSVVIKDVGADQVKAAPDGTVTLTITGQVPFDFVGALVVDLDTGELVKEPVFRGEKQLEKACRLLGGA